MDHKCRRCFLRELDNDTYKTVESYIESLDSNLKVDESAYNCRLAICEKCSHLMNSMCRLCGCFVEVRAVKKVSKCPDTPSKW